MHSNAQNTTEHEATSSFRVDVDGGVERHRPNRRPHPFGASLGQNVGQGLPLQPRCARTVFVGTRGGATHAARHRGGQLGPSRLGRRGAGTQRPRGLGGGARLEVDVVGDRGGARQHGRPRCPDSPAVCGRRQASSPLAIAPAPRPQRQTTSCLQRPAAIHRLRRRLDRTQPVECLVLARPWFRRPWHVDCGDGRRV